MLLLAVLADWERVSKFSSRTIGSWLYCSRFGIWTKGRQYFDDAGICSTDKNVNLRVIVVS
jgi:hypothetical protein